MFALDLRAALSSNRPDEDKVKLVYLFMESFRDIKPKLCKRVMDEVTPAALAEIRRLHEVYPATPTYRERETMGIYARTLVMLIMLRYGSAERMPPSDRAPLDELFVHVRKDAFIEREVRGICEGGRGAPENVERLLAYVRTLTEEYHKGALYRGLIRYREYIKTLPLASLELLGEYVTEQMQEYLARELDAEATENLAMLCDLAQYFLSDTVVSLVYRAMSLGEIHLTAHAAMTLLGEGLEVPDEVITRLCHELSMAAQMFGLLAELGMEERFPAELATVEYITKSRMVQWLLYPTELGCEPDGIEYLGKVKKGDVYHIFRFISHHSPCLDEARLGVWLVGWVAEEGTAFSHFEPLANFEQKTLEKTLKCIKRKQL